LWVSEFLSGFYLSEKTIIVILMIPFQKNGVSLKGDRPDCIVGLNKVLILKILQRS